MATSVTPVSTINTGWWLDDSVWEDDTVWEDEFNDENFKTNIQLFRDDDVSNQMFPCVHRPNLPQQRSYWRIVETFIYSEYFAGFVWDNKLLDLAVFYTRDYFVANYEAIINALKYAGTYDSYYTIITSALGECDIVFENPHPSHLVINISNVTETVEWESLYDEERVEMIPDQTQYPNDYFVFASKVSNLTISQTQALIQMLNINGVFIEINYIE